MFAYDLETPHKINNRLWTLYDAAYVSTNWGEPAFLGSFRLFQIILLIFKGDTPAPIKMFKPAGQRAMATFVFMKDPSPVQRKNIAERKNKKRGQRRSEAYPVAASATVRDFLSEKVGEARLLGHDLLRRLRSQPCSQRDRCAPRCAADCELSGPGPKNMCFLKCQTCVSSTATKSQSDLIDALESRSRFQRTLDLLLPMPEEAQRKCLCREIQE